MIFTMKVDRSYDYMFISFADAIIIGTLLVSVGRYMSPYYFIYLIIAIILILIGLELYKYSTYHESHISAQAIELPKFEPIRIKQHRKGSPFPLSSKKSINHKKSTGSSVVGSSQVTQGSRKNSKWETVRKSVVKREPLYINVSEDITISSGNVSQVTIRKNSEDSRLDDDISSMTIPLSRSKKLRKSIKRFVVARTMSLYARSKMRLSSNENDRN